LVLQNLPTEGLSLGDARIDDLSIGSTTAKFDLTLGLAEAPAGIDGALEYSVDLYDGTTAARLLHHFAALLSSAVTGLLRPLSQLPLLAEGERAQLLREWNDACGDLPAEPRVHRLFEAQVERSPEAIAVEMGDIRLSYGEVEARANRLARHLAAHGVEADR